MKKKTIAVVGRFAASIAMFLILMTAEANAQLPDQILSLGNLASSLKTPQDVSHYIWRHFNFEKDQTQFSTEDYWQSAEQILGTQKGDCEDFAVFARDILKRKGLPAFVLNIYGSRPHAICIFKLDGRYGAIDGKNYIAADFKDINSLVTYLDPFWKKAAITEMNENRRGRILKEINNTRKPARFLFWK